MTAENPSPPVQENLTSVEPQQAHRPTDSQRDAAAAILVSEYEFVEGLIPFYRHMELTALAGTGLVASAAVTAVAAIEAGNHANHDAQAILLSASAWGPTLLLLLEVVALTRIRRAATYITEHVRPLANELAGQTRLLEWEIAPSSELIGAMQKAQPRGEGIWAQVAHVAASKRLVNFFLSSAPLIAMIWAVSVALGTAGAVLRPITASFGMPAVALGLALGLYGVAASRRHEARVSPASGAAGDQVLDELPPAAEREGPSPE